MPLRAAPVRARALAQALAPLGLPLKCRRPWWCHSKNCRLSSR